MRRGRAADDVPPVEVETDPHEPPVVARSARIPSGTARSLGLVALGALVGVLATLTVTRDDERAAPPAVSVTTAPVPRSTAGTTTSTSPSTTLSPAGLPALPVLPLGHPTGIVLYLTPSGGAPDALIAYDVDRGEAHRIELGRDVGWYIRAAEGAGGVVVDGGAVVAVAGGTARLLDDSGESGFSDAPVGRVAPGPGGGFWLRRFDPPEIELLDEAGQPAGVHLGLPRGADLFGSMADGRPVVRGEDGQAFVVELDGQRTELARNALAPVEAGRFSEIRCDAAQRCALIAHLDGREIDLGSPRGADGSARLVRFQRNGPLVAILEGNHLSLFDTGSGVLVPDVVTDLDAGVFGSNEASAWFLPDGSGLVATTREGMVFVDPSGETLARITLHSAPAPGPVLLGVGVASPWQSG